jgi:hypothetical protein
MVAVAAASSGLMMRISGDEPSRAKDNEILDLLPCEGFGAKSSQSLGDFR